MTHPDQTPPAAAPRPVPTGPLDSEPFGSGSYPSPEHQATQIRHALRGVALGAYDERIAAWAVRTLDDSTLRTLLSWIERARAAELVAAGVGPAGATDADGAHWWASDDVLTYIEQQTGKRPARSTWEAYVTRGQAPKPGRRVGRTPQWDAALIRAWHADRPGQAWRAGQSNTPASPTDPL